jgi:hypothetical protein
MGISSKDQMWMNQRNIMKNNSTLKQEGIDTNGEKLFLYIQSKYVGKKSVYHDHYCTGCGINSATLGILFVSRVSLV